MEITLAIGGVIAAVIAFLGGRYAYKRESDENSIKLINSLFGELSHTLQHYRYASIELPPIGTDDVSKRELKKRLLWSKYGEFRSSKEFQNYGFLSNIEIKELLQLAFRIRNTDDLIDILMQAPELVTEYDLVEVKRRMGYVSGSANDLLQYIVKLNPEFASAYESIKGGK